ncbi:response regulator [Pantanalinema sp. GBBB05]|uniref:response regulator n=1 Tax=Pantanalinema sp. GBBB05 TaxID=2604139 RepID=UPI001D33FD94|nr:response regulator [Pantanalinema sp. GBBB05]
MTIHILLVEDSPSDADLLLEVMEEAMLPTHLYVVEDGVEALAFLRRQGQYADMPRPDLILLDLNLPRKDGREVLAEVKTDRDLGTIPIVVLTTSAASEDIRRAYELHANCYITKPTGLDDFVQMVKVLEQFWLTAVKLPPHPD